MTRPRLRDLGITTGSLPPGPFNAITDVSDVWVGHATVVHDSPRVARTGVTVVVPRAGHIHENSVFAGFHVPSPWEDSGDGSWPLSGTSSLVGVIATETGVRGPTAHRLPPDALQRVSGRRM